jgi:predicted MFS family arabinose efflux permease
MSNEPAGALFALIFGLIKGPDYGWGSARTLAFLGAAALLGLLFILRESRARQPLLPLTLFRSASLSAGVVLVILLMFALFGAMFFMTFFLENVHGLSPIAAGVHLLPMTAMLIAGSPLAGAVIGRTGPRIPIVAGMALAATAMFGSRNAAAMRSKWRSSGPGTARLTPSTGRSRSTPTSLISPRPAARCASAMTAAMSWSACASSNGR